MEIIIFAGPQFGHHKTYDLLWGLIYGLDIGYHIGPGVLFGTFHAGMKYAFGVGYRIGFFKRIN